MLFVEAVSKLSPEERQHFTLDVYGNDEENHLNEIQQLIKRYGLNHIIQYKGFLDPNEREEKISRYDVMILTSYQGKLRYYSFRITPTTDSCFYFRQSKCS